MSKFRVLFIPAIESGAKEHSTNEFDTLAEANAVKSAIADYTLFLHDNVLMPDYSNAGWVEQFVDGEWEEVEDE